MKYDLVIKNGNVIDLDECTDVYKPWKRLDIGIKDKRIINIGHIDPSESSRVLDATNMIVSPGFIDIHSHSDTYLLANSKAESKISQGVTTEVIGNCGLSAAPLGGVYTPAKSILGDVVEPDWISMSEYLEKLEKNGSSVNVVPLVGHNNIKGAVMGYSDQEATSKELEQMKTLLQDSFDAGVWGLSTGLNMPPGSFSSTKEIIELCKVASSNGGVYHTHIRGQGDRLLSATMEAIEIAKKSEIPLHILHHKGMGDANAAKVECTLEMIDEGIGDGMNITMDMYPYLAGQGGLAMFFPFWVHEGGTEKMIERLKDKDLRKKIKHQMIEPELLPGYQSYSREIGWKHGWEKVILCNVNSEKNQHLVGLSIQDAKPEGIDPIDFLFDLFIQEKGDIPVVIPDVTYMDDRYFQMVIRHPNTMLGSDGYSLTFTGPLAQGVPHPRSYGSFPKVLGQFVRAQKLFTWKEAIRKMSYLPAAFLGLKDRGVIREDAFADIVIFNPETVIDNSTLEDPVQYPTGIDFVIVNGEIVIENGQHTGKLSGNVLKKNSS